MKILITGGGGFLGKALGKALIKRGHTVRSYSRGEHVELKALGFKIFRGDITDKKSLSIAAKGCDAIFHTAAKVGVWGPYEEYYQTNVVGTQTVIDVCLNEKITKLIFTSSPSVVFNGVDQENVNESESYPEKYLSNYPKTKAEAEKLIIFRSRFFKF